MDFAFIVYVMWFLATAAAFLRGAAGAALVRSNATVSFVMKAYNARGWLAATFAAVFGVHVSCLVWLAQVAVAATRLYYGMDPWSSLPEDGISIVLSRAIKTAITTVYGFLPASSRSSTSVQGAASSAARTDIISNIMEVNPTSTEAPMGTTTTSSSTTSSLVMCTSGDATCRVDITENDRNEARWRGYKDRQAEQQARAALLAQMDARARAAAGTGVMQQQDWTIYDVIQSLEEKGEPVTQQTIIRAMLHTIFDRMACSQPATAADAATFDQDADLDTSVEWAPAGGWAVAAADDAPAQEDAIQKGRNRWRALRVKKEVRWTAVQRIKQMCEEEAHRLEVEAARAERRALAVARGMVV